MVRRQPPPQPTAPPSHCPCPAPANNQHPNIQTRKGENGDREVQRTMLELLNQLDGFNSTDRIKVRATHPPPTHKHTHTNICTHAHTRLGPTTNTHISTHIPTYVHMHTHVLDAPQRTFLPTSSVWPLVVTLTLTVTLTPSSVMPLRLRAEATVSRVRGDGRDQSSRCCSSCPTGA